MSQTGEVQGIPFDRCSLLQAPPLDGGRHQEALAGSEANVGPPLSKPFPGFYCEVDLDHQLTAEDVSRISAAMDQLRSEDRLGSREAPVQDDRRRLHFKLFNSSALTFGEIPQRTNPTPLRTAWPTRMELRRDIARHDWRAERDYRKIGGLSSLPMPRGVPGALFGSRRASRSGAPSRKNCEAHLEKRLQGVTGDPALLYQGTERINELPPGFLDRLGFSPAMAPASPCSAREDYQDSTSSSSKISGGEITAVMGFVRRVHAALNRALRPLEHFRRAPATGTGSPTFQAKWECVE